MSDEYVPTMEDVRTAYIWLDDAEREITGAEFDRWLAAHDAEVRKSARREFVQEIRDLGAQFEAAVLHEADEVTP